MSLRTRLLGNPDFIRGKRVAITGMSGAFGKPMAALLETSGAAQVKGLKYGVDYSYGDYSKLDGVLRESDVLVLAHGSKLDHAMEANCDSFVAILERSRKLHPGRTDLEVWATGSEIEVHPAWGNKELQIYLESKRAFARHAWGYFRDPSFVYRHICPAGFRSQMGPGLISGETAAKMALFFIRRGFRYVPVTYTGFAFANYLKFALHREDSPRLGSGAA
jgi:hypothetical protein